MSMDLSEMVPRVLANAPACPQPVAEAYLLLAAIDFCRRSMAWGETITVSAMTADSFPYTITPLYGAVSDVLSVALDGAPYPLEEVTRNHAAQNIDEWETATGIPAMFVEYPKGVITLVPIPDTTVSVKIIVALEPARDDSDIPDDIYNRFADAIISGAICKLALIPGVSWTNGDLAMVHKRFFDEGVAEARREFHLNFTRPTLSTSLLTI